MENSYGRSRERERNVKLGKGGGVRGNAGSLVEGERVCVCAVTLASEAQHFPCGVDECKCVAVGGW